MLAGHAWLGTSVVTGDLDSRRLRSFSRSCSRSALPATHSPHSTSWRSPKSAARTTRECPVDEQRSSTLVMTMTKTVYLVMRRLGPVRELALVLVPAPSLRLLVLLRLPLTVLPRPLQWRMLGLLVAPPAPPQRLMATTMGGRRQGVGAAVDGAAEDLRGKGSTHTHLLTTRMLATSPCLPTPR